MIPIMRRYLRPYHWPLVLVLALLLVQAIANLYLPELNADIINNGVVKGDTDYIMRTGGFMLVVTFMLTIAAIVARLLERPDRDGLRPRRARPLFRKVETFSPGRGQHVRRGLAHHPQHQ